MKLQVAAAGRPRTVEVRRTPEGDTVDVDGRARSLSVAKAGRRWALVVDHRSYEVSVVEHGRGEFTVYVNGRAVPVSIGAYVASGFSRTSVASGFSPTIGTPGFSRTVEAGDPLPIVAPMPGRIVKVLVNVGDVVAARQGLVVVEAMKMENELRAPRAGTVTEVKVVEGVSVEAQAVLVILE